MQDFKQEKYQEVFDSTFAMLENRRNFDPSFTIASLEELMQAEYVNDGNDWVGRGSLQDVVVEATLAAYEVFYVEWKNNLNK